ncbi:hypothetical protein AUC68_06220 [Methyloceanibacter methanicus]|uniref:phosphoglycolate phosphatase n=1 Tax=Methyloceanibacter methanicus TaxID=1774968 RepID=A0A1E3VZ12_9HYPH|nr:HAD hydrolase-like protein [Methyloceanibacter methanicus]ODR98794.1 hypothetical protein AUC68_06220 [Methyloceanibacter methanicus]
MDRFRTCRAVVFDLDGTLADTVGDIADALNRTLSDFDLPPHPEDAVRGMVGNGLAKLLERGFSRHGVVLDETTRERACRRLLEHYAGRPCERARLYPGARAMLDALGAARIDCAVLTNKHEPIARDVIHGLGIAGSIKAVRGADVGFARKPDPAGLLDLVRTLGARPETTLMVGDSETDLKTARAGGLRGAVLVSHGYSAIPVAELGADAVINHLHELVAGLALAPEAD